MTSVLHVLPHPGGGAETYIDILEAMAEVSHRRAYLSRSRGLGAGGRSIPIRWPGVARQAGRVDLVHVHGDAAAILSLPLLRSRPSVWTTHGLHLLRRAGGLTAPGVGAAVRSAVALAGRTLCTSEIERSELAELVGPLRARALVTVHNGIEPHAAPTVGDRAKARRDLGLRDDDVVALFLGELEPRKAPLDAVVAAEQVRASGGQLVLLVAGGGTQAAAVSRHAGEAVRPLGHRDDVPVLLAASDLFVMPSQREGLSFALLEAMSSGLATVVSDGPGNAEAVGQAGLIVPTGDVAALAAALGRLTADKQKRERLGVSGRERVTNEFTAERLVAEVEAVYAATLGDLPA